MSDPGWRRPALVLLDCQEGVAGRPLADASQRRDFCTSVGTAIETAQRNGWPCVRVEVEFRSGFPEVAGSNQYFDGVRQAGRLEAGSGQEVPMAELATAFGTIPRVVKRRIGAFTGTDLAHLLRGLDADGVILAGLVTRGAVLSTACHAADLDYRVAVLRDACFDPDPVVHRVLVDEVLPMRARVLTVGELAELGRL